MTSSMRIAFPISIACLLSLLPFAGLHAQDSLTASQVLRAGVFGGPQFNFYRGPFDIFEGSTVCGTFETGSGRGAYLAGIVEIPLARSLFLRIGAGYAGYGGTFDAPVRLGTAIDPSGNLVDATADQTLEATLSYLSLIPAAMYFPIESLPLHLQLGPSIGFAAAKSFTQRERLTAPPGATFGDGTQDHVIGSGEIARVKSVRLGLNAAIGYDLSLSRNVLLTPEVHYDLPLTQVTGDPTWKASGLAAGVALKWAFLPPPRIAPPPLPPPVVPKTYAPPVVQLTREGTQPAGGKSAAQEIVLEEIRTTERRPILPYIFFEQGEGSKALRQELLTKEQTSTFSISAIRGNELEIYPHVLDIIGERLRTNPAATITITGANNGFEAEKNNTALSRQRAETVKNYFTGIWGIDPSRISVQTRNLPLDATAPDAAEGREENRRVEISSPNPEILHPLARDERQNSISLASIDFLPRVTAEAGLRQWDFSLKQGGRILHQSSGSGDDLPALIRWDLTTRPVMATGDPVTIDFFASDRQNQTRALHEEIPVRALTIEKKREERIGDMLVNRSGLIVFDFDKATLSDRNRRIVDEVKTAITPQSRVTIVGYTDALGEVEHNQKLSLQRAEAVRAAMGAAVKDDMVKTEGRGSRQLLFPNDTPEGRFYCRMVQIIIETPVK